MGLCQPLASLAAASDTRFICHAGFEQAVWELIMVERFRFAPIPIGRWCDTQASCAYHSLPLDLERALVALGSPVVKDKEGRRIVLSLSRRDKTGHYPAITPGVLERVGNYNRTDVDGMAALDKAVGRLPERERRVWELDQTINRRGIAIDLDYVRGAKGISDRLMAELREEFRGLTGGLNPTQVLATLRWLAERGLVLESLDGDTIKETLISDDLPPDILRVLKIRATIAASSLKKLDRMLQCVGPDGRVRGSLQYHGAMTGRWAGRLLQPQNLPRPTVKIDDPEALVAAVKTGDVNALRPWGDDLIDVLVSGLRHALIARDGTVLGSGDFATIEARIVLALAGQDDKVAVLASGADVYRDMAADIYGLDKAAFMRLEKELLTLEQKERRQVGKNTVLGCGFALWWEGFRDRYLKHLPAAERDGFAKKVIYTYRKVWAPMVPRLWYDLELAATAAVCRPGNVIETECGVQYRLKTKAGIPFLVCQLLNGKNLYYPNPRIEERMTHRGNTKAGVVYDAMKDHQWRGVSAWHGRLTEHVVSGLARELLVDAVFRFEERGFPVVLTVHDEIVVEHPAITEQQMVEIMSEQPKWAIDLGVPIAVEAWFGKRYRK